MAFTGPGGGTGSVRAGTIPLATDNISTRSPRHVAEGYRRCGALARRSLSFFYAFAPLPAPQRRAVHAALHFCRSTAHIADGSLPTEAKQLALDRQQRLVDRLYRGEDTVDSVEAAALADAIRRFSIPRHYFDDFLLGIRGDLTPPRYDTFADLRTDGCRAASAFALITVDIIGYDRRHAQTVHAAAVDLGIAMRLTAILRDVKKDARRGRLYLPEAEREEYDLTAADFARGMMDERFRGFMAFQVRRVRQHFRRASRLLAYVPRRSRACPATLIALYSRLLHRIERCHYDVFRHKTELSPVHKAGLALLTFGRTWLLPAPPSS